MFTITDPRPRPGRVRFLDVEFVDGVATVESLHPVRKLALEQHGYTVAEVPAPRFTQDEVRVEFEPLPVAVEGDTVPKVSRPRKRKKG